MKELIAATAAADANARPFHRASDQPKKRLGKKQPIPQMRTYLR